MRAFTAVALVVCLHSLQLVQSASAAATDGLSVRRQITDYGIGAKLNLKLAGGRKLSGRVSAINDNGFQIAKANATAVDVTYDEVGRVKLAQRAYHAGPDSDPAGARRVV